MDYVWHLINPDSSVVRSVKAEHLQQARLRLAPIESHQLVVSAISHDVKETREVVASRQGRCDICGNFMHGERAGIYNNTHRYCYENDRKKNMSPVERAAYTAKRREYREAAAERALIKPASNYGRRPT